MRRWAPLLLLLLPAARPAPEAGQPSPGPVETQIAAVVQEFRGILARLSRPTFRDGRPDLLPGLEREYGLGMTTPREMARLMAVIAEGRALDRAASDVMLATLRRQQDRAMIPRLLPSEGVTVGNKTGSDEEKHAGPDGVRRHVRADAAIITGPDLHYVVAIYAREIEDRRWSVENAALTTGARDITNAVRTLRRQADW